MLRGAIIFLSAVSLACAGLEPIEPDLCGNGVIEETEDCDRFENGSLGPNLRCAQEGETNECRYVCEPDGAPACPIGWSCGPDGACRYASGELYTPPGSPLLLPNQRFRMVDADADGSVDLAAYLGGRIELRYGDPQARFGEHTQLEIDHLSGAPAFYDVDGDGFLDVLAATELGLVLFRLGSHRRLEVKVPSRPVDLPESAELTVVSLSDRTLYFWTAGQNVVAGFEPGVVALQLPGVRLPDLRAIAPAGAALTSPGSSSVSWVSNECGVDPAPCVVQTALPAPVRDGVLLTDVDGDGAIELVASTSAGIARAEWMQAVAVLDPALDFLDGDFPLAHGDLDGDGAADFVGASCIHLAGGAELECALEERIEAVVADVDGDGRGDVASIRGSGNFIEVRTASASARVDTYDRPRSLRAGDLDGDGASDLAWIEDATGSVYASYTLREPARREVLQPGLLTLALAPLDADDQLADLEVTYLLEGARRRALLLGTSRRRTLAPVVLPDGARVRSVYAGRFIREDRVDAVMLADDGLWLVEGVGSSTLAPDAARFGGLGGCLAGAPSPLALAAAADLDHNGTDDLLVIDDESNTLDVLRFLASTDSPDIRCVSANLEPELDDLHGLRIEDFDRDGRLDLLIEARNAILIFGTASDGSVFDMQRGQVLADVYSAAPLGFDDDAELELAVLSRRGVCIADNVCASELVELPGFGFGSIESADLNDDGLLDFAFSDRTQVHVRILRAHGEEELP